MDDLTVMVDGARRQHAASAPAPVAAGG